MSSSRGGRCAAAPGDIHGSASPISSASSRLLTKIENNFGAPVPRCVTCDILSDEKHMIRKLSAARREVTMARRTSPPFRADHVGSLLRPPAAAEARDDFAAGGITAAELSAVEDEAIRAAIAMQEEVGLQSATDGEFRRASWHMDFIYAARRRDQGARRTWP